MVMFESKWVVLVAAISALLVLRRRRNAAVRIEPQQPRESRAQQLSSGASPTSQSRFVVEIEYCTRCRWMLRSAWLAQELLTTFQPTNDDANASTLSSVVLTPNAQQGGIFDVTLRCPDDDDGGEDNGVVLWSRKQRGRFPESKELKQLVRDHICPDKSLGHSDRKDRTD